MKEISRAMIKQKLFHFSPVLSSTTPHFSSSPKIIFFIRETRSFKFFAQVIHMKLFNTGQIT